MKSMKGLELELGRRIMRYEIRLAGTGGQGVILAGLVLAEAGVFERHYVVHTQNYGPAARGGTSVSEVIFSDAEIDYPKTLGLDILLALNQKACDENLSDMKPEGLVIIDANLVDKVFWGKVVRVPISQRAQKKFNDQKVANMLALGTLVLFCPWVSPRCLRKAIMKRMPPEIIQLNLSAFQEGLALARRLKKCLKFEEIEEATEV